MAAPFEQRVRELFEQACEKPEAERRAFLQTACEGNPDLYKAVDSLLAARVEASSFLNSGMQPVRRIGRYVIQGELGRGGMGIVYDAHDPMIGRNVAVKVIHLRAMSEGADESFLRERLFREARSCGKLLHPNIVIVFDVGQADDAAFIAMERVDGPSLLAILSTGQLTAAESVRIIRQTAAALDFAHAHGIVHRDIKPANIMLNREGTVKVADFGIAKIMSGASTTVTQAVIGTPSYMSPEQIEAGDLDGRSDQFSLAVLSYELLTGTKPFQGDSIATLAHQIVYGARPSAQAAKTSLPKAIDTVFERAFSRMREDRFANCSAFGESLEAVFAAPAVPKPTPAASRPTVPVAIPPLPAKRSSLRPAVFVPWLILVCFVVGTAVLYWQRPATNPPKTAEIFAPKTVDAAEKTISSPPPLIPPAAPNAAPLIKQFRADPGTVKTGTPAMLVWEVAGADKVVIDHGVGKVAGKGMVAVVPTVSTTYALTASDQAGSTRRVASIEVEADPDAVPRSVRARQFFAQAQAKRRDGQTDQAAELFTKAAELGDSGAMVELGEMYSSGEGVAEDEAKALNWFKRAAEAGNVSGMVALGGVYLLGGSGNDPNEEEAARWFQKAAERDSPAALYDLAMLYESGRGVPKSLDKAKDLYQKAGALGNHEAQKRLAKLGVPAKN